MGRMQRDKGANAEREVANLAKAKGFDARRLAQLQAGTNTEPGDADVGLGIEHVFLEVKRVERIRLLEWSRQAEASALPSQAPAVAYRPNGEPWRVSMLLDDWLDMLKAATL